MPKTKATHEPLRVRIPSNTSKPSKPPRQHQIRFGQVSATEAAEGRMKKADRQNYQLSARQQACSLYVGKLVLSPEQSIAIQRLYDANETESYEFHVGGEAEQKSQQAAATVMGIHGLTFTALDEVDNRWSVAWSENTGEGDSTMKRVLLQCDCGYDHTVAGSKTRNTPAPYTACLAHAEITYVVSTQKIYRVRGCFQHNDACKDALLTRIPREYLHPSVYRLALDQLANGIPLKQVRKNNRDLVRSRSFPDMSLDPRQWRYRYLIGKTDTASLYRQLSRLQGVNVDQRPHVNIHEWLDTSSPQYDSVFAEAVFHYNERAERGDCVEVCIATKEMKEAAWKYGHGKQLIMDGTFGICNRKVLLFVLMGVDEENKGIPLAFLFFSAPSGNKHTAAGYDSEVLGRLLEKWKQSLEAFQGGRRFMVKVAITDTDLKERIALLRVFPDIILLICRVHLRRSWRNHRNKCLPGKDLKDTDTWRRLQALEDALVLSTSFEAAKALVENEYDILRHDLPNDDPTQAGALEHLDYLWGYWMSSGKSDDLWKSWSDFGRTVAAQLLHCPLHNIIPTTNHLESFNRVLKHTYLPQAQHGGHRLRFDVLLKFIIRDMMPSIFEERSARLEELNRRKARALCLVNGEQLWNDREQQPGSAYRAVPVAYLTPDDAWEAAATGVLNHKQIGHPELLSDQSGLVLIAISSLSTEHDNNPIQYQIHLFFSGRASCSCPDFASHGGACKHIRAALMYIERLRGQFSIPPIPIPLTEQGARLLYTDLALTGDQSSASLSTTPAGKADLLLPAITRAAERLEDIINERVDLHDTDTEPVDDEPHRASPTSREDLNDTADNHSNPDEEVPVMRSHIGAQEQGRARYLHAIRVNMPKLEEFAGILSEITLCHEDLVDTDRFLNVLHRLSRDIEQKRLGVSARHVPFVPPSTPPPRDGKRKCSAHEVLSPSPEKKQKRHESYSIH